MNEEENIVLERKEFNCLLQISFASQRQTRLLLHALVSLEEVTETLSEEWLEAVTYRKQAEDILENLKLTLTKLGEVGYGTHPSSMEDLTENIKIH